MQESDVLEFTKNDENSRTRNVFIKVTGMNGKLYTDQTERFPVASSRNNKYIMISYDYDSNIINAEYLKSRTGCVLKSCMKNYISSSNHEGYSPKYSS